MAVTRRARSRCAADDPGILQTVVPTALAGLQLRSQHFPRQAGERGRRAMKTCGRCERQIVVSITLDDNIDACGHTFIAQLPAEKCQVCGQIVIQGEDLKQFELRVAVELAKAGLRDKEAFKLLRKALALDAKGLAHILDVPEEFIGYWERGEWPPDVRAHAVLASLVLAKFEQ